VRKKFFSIHVTYKTQRNFFIMYRSYIPIFIARLPIHAPFPRYLPEDRRARARFIH